VLEKVCWPAEKVCRGRGLDCELLLRHDR
jgi:hypothetical protein